MQSKCWCFPFIFVFVYFTLPYWNAAGGTSVTTCHFQSTMATIGKEVCVSLMFFTWQICQHYGTHRLLKRLIYCVYIYIYIYTVYILHNKTNKNWIVDINCSMNNLYFIMKVMLAYLIRLTLAQAFKLSSCSLIIICHELNIQSCYVHFLFCIVSNVVVS